MKKNKDVEAIRLKINKTTRTLECKLTKEELADCSKLLAEGIRRKKQIEDELAAFKAQKKSELTAIAADISIQSGKINSEKEYRSVDCEARTDYSLSRFTITRKDTGEEIENRPLDASEKQMELEIGGGIAS